MVRAPVGHDVALEAELALEQLVQRPVVLARPRRVHLVWSASFVSSYAHTRRERGGRTVAAHHARDAGHDRAHERVQVDLVLRAVVDVRRLLCAPVLLLAVPGISMGATDNSNEKRAHLLM